MKKVNKQGKRLLDRHPFYQIKTIMDLSGNFNLRGVTK